MPKDLVNKKGIEVHPTALSFHEMLAKARDHTGKCIAQALDYSKERWDKTHKTPELKVGDNVLISTVNFNNLQGPKKLRDSFVGPFVIIKMHGPNAAEVILTGEFSRKHPTFPVSLLKHFEQRTGDKKKESETEVLIPYEEDTPKVAHKVLQHKRVLIEGKRTLLYLVRYKNKGADHDEWLPAEKVPNAKVTLRAFRAINRGHEPVKTA